MGNMTSLFIFVVCFNLLMWVTQASIININPDSTINLFNSSNGDLVGGIKDNIDTIDVQSELPGGGSTVETGSGNIFTDIFGNIKNFFMDTLGLKYVVGIMKAPYYFLKALGLPAEFVSLVGSAWYLISFVVVVVFMFRGSD